MFKIRIEYNNRAYVAQWIARWTSNPKVAGSNPAVGNNNNSFFNEATILKHSLHITCGGNWIIEHYLLFLILLQYFFSTPILNKVSLICFSRKMTSRHHKWGGRARLNGNK